MDVMTVKIETENNDKDAFNSSIISTLKLKGNVELVSPGSLPRDGVVVEDLRKYD
jgi:phenylacetate-CoA ligase